MVAGGAEAVHIVFLLCAHAAKQAQVANRKTARKKDRELRRTLAQTGKSASSIMFMTCRLAWEVRGAKAGRKKGERISQKGRFVSTSAKSNLLHASLLPVVWRPKFRL